MEKNVNTSIANKDDDTCSGDQRGVDRARVKFRASTERVDFVDELRARGVPEALKPSQSWAELEDRLAAHGLVLQRSGRGLQVTDGDQVAKISALHRKSSLKNLELRFGETWNEWAQRRLAGQAAGCARSGHSGSVFSLHAGSSAEVLRQLVTFTGDAGVSTSVEECQNVIDRMDEVTRNKAFEARGE